ncbi:MAG: hypothetical protein ABFC34_14455 [Methanobacterium sp.]
MKHFSELEKLDIKANLTLCGCLPPREFVHERMRVLAFLDRNDENDRNLMNSI